jgi:hypothetical protein
VRTAPIRGGLGQHRAAIADHEQAASLFDELVEKDPADVFVQGQLSGVLEQRPADPAG